MAQIRRIPLLAVVFALALADSSQTAGAQGVSRGGVIDGVVTDTSLVPLGDATVSFLGSNVRVVTGANGRFRVRDMNPGAYVLLVRRIGFEAASLRVELSAGDTARPSFALQRAATTLDTVAIKAQRLTPAMQEFEARRKLGFGHFITQFDIDKQNPRMLSDLLVGIPSVEVGALGGWPTNIRSGCPFVVYIDGVRLPTGSDFDGLSPPKGIAGIEIYSGAATIPVQYKPTSGSFCGVILLWSRIGN
jgi:hypothetical protein